MPTARVRDVKVDWITLWVINNEWLQKGRVESQLPSIDNPLWYLIWISSFFVVVRCVYISSDESLGTEALDVAELEDAMENIQTIDMFLFVTGKHENFTSLSMFKNLREIKGNEQFGLAKLFTIFNFFNVTSFL